jgi:hypothetical protein
MQGTFEILSLALGVELASSLVQDEHFRVLQNRPCDAYPLPLPRAQAHLTHLFIS